MSIRISSAAQFLGFGIKNANPEIKQMQKLTQQMLSSQVKDIQKAVAKVPVAQASDVQALQKSLEQLAQLAKIK